MSPLESKALYIKQRITKDIWGKAKHASTLEGMNLTDWLSKVVEEYADKVIAKFEKLQSKL